VQSCCYDTLVGLRPLYCECGAGAHIPYLHASGMTDIDVAMSDILKRLLLDSCLPWGPAYVRPLIAFVVVGSVVRPHKSFIVEWCRSGTRNQRMYVRSACALRMTH
jgi:hypothetical protein